LHQPRSRRSSPENTNLDSNGLSNFN
jgi:hypothetical protein